MIRIDEPRLLGDIAELAQIGATGRWRRVPPGAQPG